MGADWLIRPRRSGVILITPIAKCACYFGLDRVFSPPIQRIQRFLAAVGRPAASATPGPTEIPGVAYTNIRAPTVYYPGNGLTRPSYTRVIR